MSTPCDPTRWRRIEELFAEARTREDREAFLAAACAGDPDLEQEVRSLLDASSTADGFFSRLASASGLPWSSAPEPLPPGRRVGRYRLLEVLGRGGMGVVYLAEREDADFRRKVALKLLPLGLETEEARARFRRERQILARLQHPNIARLYDGGVTGEGTPYLVMEYVRGTRIDEFCDARRLPVRQRLELFMSVCSAVEEAHRNLIVHRDLKPQNILITEQGEVKLLDFGIAQTLDREMGETRTRSPLLRPMTLAYASPEQVRGEPLTTASDVYGLGVLLYRLLAGRHPYPTTPRTLAEACRLLEGRPSPPSVAVARPPYEGPEEPPSPEGVAASRQTSPSRLRRALAGDLDRIILKALRKEPERRYPSARALADDLNRHLRGYPVSARRDTLGYRISRFAGRHRTGVAAGAVVSFSLLTLLLALVRFSLTTEAQSRRIAREAETTEAVSQFLVDLFHVADPFEGLGDTLTVRTVLDRGAEELTQDPSLPPDVRARLMGTVGRVYMSLGLYVDAGDLFEKRLELLAGAAGTDSLAVAEALEALAWSYQERGRFQEAESLLSQSIAIREGPDTDSLTLAQTWAALARALREQGRADSARALVSAALAVHRRRLPPHDPAVVGLMTSLAFMDRAAGEFEEAELLYREALEAYRGMEDQGGRPAASAMNNLAFLLRKRGELEEAERLYRRAEEDYARWRSPPETQILLGNLAAVLWELGKQDETLRTLEERHRLAKADWPDGDWRVGLAAMSVGEFHTRTGHPERAEPWFREALSSYAEQLGEEHGWTLNARSLLGAVLAQEGRFSEAEPYLLSGYEGLVKVEGEENSFTIAARSRLAEMYVSWGFPEKAAGYEHRSDGGGV